MDEVRIVINGEVHGLWRAVDRNSRVLDILVQMRMQNPQPFVLY
ncbi:MAG: DDE-type integrase/transposase/recombinase [Synechococcus sp.]